MRSAEHIEPPPNLVRTPFDTIDPLKGWRDALHETDGQAPQVQQTQVPTIWFEVFKAIQIICCFYEGDAGDREEGCRQTDAGQMV